MNPENYPPGIFPLRIEPSSNDKFKSPTKSPFAEFAPILAVSSIEPEIVYPFPENMKALIGGWWQICSAEKLPFAITA